MNVYSEGWKEVHQPEHIVRGKVGNLFDSFISSLFPSLAAYCIPEVIARLGSSEPSVICFAHHMRAYVQGDILNQPKKEQGPSPCQLKTLCWHVRVRPCEYAFGSPSWTFHPLWPIYIYSTFFFFFFLRFSSPFFWQWVQRQRNFISSISTRTEVPLFRVHSLISHSVILCELRFGRQGIPRT